MGPFFPRPGIWMGQVSKYWLEHPYHNYPQVTLSLLLSHPPPPPNQPPTPPPIHTHTCTRDSFFRWRKENWSLGCQRHLNSNFLFANWSKVSKTSILQRLLFDDSIKMIRYITKTCLYNLDPLKPHFHIVKLGFTGVYIIFVISAQNIDCGYSLEPPRRGGSNEYPQSMFWAEIWNYQSFLPENFQVLEVKLSLYLNRRFFRYGPRI